MQLVTELCLNRSMKELLINVLYNRWFKNFLNCMQARCDFAIFIWATANVTSWFDASFKSDLRRGRNKLFITDWGLDDISNSHCLQVPAAAFPVIGVKSAHTALRVVYLVMHEMLWGK